MTTDQEKEERGQSPRVYADPRALPSSRSMGTHDVGLEGGVGGPGGARTMGPPTIHTSQPNSGIPLGRVLAGVDSGTGVMRWVHWVSIS